MSRCFLMIPQTRQCPTMSATTSMECTVARAMPDDWSMRECCRCYTVPRPFRFNENTKNELVNGKRKQKYHIRCPMNISSWSFRVSYLQIKGEEILYLHYITPCDLFWFEYTALSLCQLQTRTCFKMHAGGFWGSANHRNHLMLRLSRFGAIWHYLTLNPSDAFFFSSPKQDDARLIEMRSLMSGPVFKRRLACNNNQSLMQ